MLSLKSPNPIGISPVMEFSATSNQFNEVKLPRDSGNGPAMPGLLPRLFLNAVKDSRLAMLPILAGIVPENAGNYVEDCVVRKVRMKTSVNRKFF